MREFKFRVWSKYTRKMFDEGYYLSIDGGLFQNDCLDYKNKESFEIMQYTGSKDKNGKEIYEGDIVAVSEEYGGHAYKPLVVDFKACCFVLRKANYLADFNPMYNYDFTQVYEIIGNIYENPELLNGNWILINKLIIKGEEK